MNLTDDQLKEVENMSAAMMTISEICMVMELNIHDFKTAMADESSHLYKSHQRGYLKSKYQVQRKIVDLAIAGSSPAQTQAHKLITYKEIEDE